MDAGAEVRTRARGMSAAVEGVFRGVLPQAPPLPLVAFVGAPEIQNALGHFLRTRKDALPCNSVGITEPENARKLFPPRKRDVDYSAAVETHAREIFQAGGGGGAGSLQESMPTEGTGLDPQSAGQPSVDGCVKTRWFEKHRKCHPASVALFVRYADFVGDPQQWTATVSAVETVSSAARQRGARVCVCVLRSPGPEPLKLPDDRVSAVRRRMDGDAKPVLLCDPDSKEDLSSLGDVLLELSSFYYRSLVQRLRKRMEQVVQQSKRRSQKSQKNDPTSSGRREREFLRLRARILVKIGTMCEFTQDWHNSLQSYKQAYNLVGDLFSASQNSVGMASVIEMGVCYLQEAREALSVAESLAAKVATLLLIQHNWVSRQRAQGGVGDAKAAGEPTEATPQLREAISLFQRHVSVFRLPLGRNPSLLAHLEQRHGLDLVEVFQCVHWSWVSYQYKKFAKLLADHVPDLDLLLEIGAHPSHYTSCAARYAVLRRQCYESSRSRKQTREGGGMGRVGGEGGEGDPTSELRASFASGERRVTAGDYLGQWEVSVGGGPRRRMGETEFLCFLESQEGRVDHREAILELLSSASDLYEGAGLRRHKLVAQIAIADEHVRCGKVQEARAMLLEVAAAQRSEGWDHPLADVLLRLRKCAQLLRMTREHVLHSLELCGLEGTVEEDQRVAIFSSVMAVLSSGEEPAPGEDASEAEAGMAALLSRAAYAFDMDQEGGAGGCVTLASLATAKGAEAIALGQDARAVVSLSSRAPLPLEVRGIRAQFSDGSECETRGAVALEPGVQAKIPLSFCPKLAGDVRCHKLEVLLGDAAALHWSGDGPALSQFCLEVTDPAGRPRAESQGQAQHQAKRQDPISCSFTIKTPPGEFPLLRQAVDAEGRSPVPPRFVIFARLSSQEDALVIREARVEGAGTGCRISAFPPLRGAGLGAGEACELVCRAEVVQPGLDAGADLGRLLVAWTDANGVEGESSFAFPGVAPRQESVAARVSFPTTGVRVGEPLALALELESRDASLSKVGVALESPGPDQILFSGYRKTEELLGPRDTRRLTWHIVPVVTGTVDLPKIRVQVGKKELVLRERVHVKP